MEYIGLFLNDNLGRYTLVKFIGDDLKNKPGFTLIMLITCEDAIRIYANVIEEFLENFYSVMDNDTLYFLGARHKMMKIIYKTVYNREVFRARFEK